jgi:hypothetical protein
VASRARSFARLAAFRCLCQATRFVLFTLPSPVYRTLRTRIPPALRWIPRHR